MLIEEMSSEANLEMLQRAHLGRLACSQGPQPYVVPFYFAYKDYSLYSFTTVGKKIDWMRANPLVCVEIDEVASPLEWTSVVVFGSYEELPDTPEHHADRDFAWKQLQRYPAWWEPAMAKPHAGENPLVQVFYRIHINLVTGRCARSRA